MEPREHIKICVQARERKRPVAPACSERPESPQQPPVSLRSWSDVSDSDSDLAEDIMILSIDAASHGRGTGQVD